MYTSVLTNMFLPSDFSLPSCNAFTVTPATIIAPPIVITTGPTPGIEKLPAKKPNGPVKATLLDCIEFPFNSSLLFFN